MASIANYGSVAAASAAASTTVITQAAVLTQAVQRAQQFSHTDDSNTSTNSGGNTPNGNIPRTIPPNHRLKSVKNSGLGSSNSYPDTIWTLTHNGSNHNRSNHSGSNRNAINSSGISTVHHASIPDTALLSGNCASHYTTSFPTTTTPFLRQPITNQSTPPSSFSSPMTHQSMHQSTPTMQHPQQLHQRRAFRGPGGRSPTSDSNFGQQPFLWETPAYTSLKGSTAQLVRDTLRKMDYDREVHKTTGGVDEYGLPIMKDKKVPRDKKSGQMMMPQMDQKRAAMEAKYAEQPADMRSKGKLDDWRWKLGSRNNRRI
jgi:hypothetical protein